MSKSNIKAVAHKLNTFLKKNDESMFIVLIFIFPISLIIWWGFWFFDLVTEILFFAIIAIYIYMKTQWKRIHLGHIFIFELDDNTKKIVIIGLCLIIIMLTMVTHSAVHNDKWWTESSTFLLLLKASMISSLPFYILNLWKLKARIPMYVSIILVIFFTILFLLWKYSV